MLSNSQALRRVRASYELLGLRGGGRYGKVFYARPTALGATSGSIIRGGVAPGGVAPGGFAPGGFAPGGFAPSRKRAREDATPSEVCVKISTQASEPFILESAEHPNIVRLLDFFSSPWLTITVTEVLDVDLRRYMKTAEQDDCEFGGDGRLCPWQRMPRHIAEALQHIHGLKILHKDIKSDNILVRTRVPAGPSFVLADFGLAESFHERSDGGFAHGGSAPEADWSAHALQFRAPELFFARGSAIRVISNEITFTPPPRVASALMMPPVDMWAFGCLVHEFCTGGLPVGTVVQMAGRRVGPHAAQFVSGLWGSIVGDVLDRLGRAVGHMGCAVRRTCCSWWRRRRRRRRDWDLGKIWRGEMGGRG